MSKRHLLLGLLAVGVFYSAGFFSAQLYEGHSPDTLNLEPYKAISTAVKQKFKMEGYEEILGQYGDTVVVPDSVSGRQDLDMGLYSREKHFIFKNKNSGVVILMSITANLQKQLSRVWDHSIGYSPTAYNLKEGRYKDSYSEKMPLGEAYTYSFSCKGYNILLLGISDNLKKENVYTLSQLAQFTEKFSEFLDANHL